MTESNQKSEFQTKKKLFDKISDDIVCCVCKIVPRHPPIYRSKNGNVVCTKCKTSTRVEYMHRDT